MKKYTAALLGIGHRGTHHAKAFLANSDRFELVAVCDLNERELKLKAEQLGIRAALYTDAEKMLSETRPDLFCFVTQPVLRLPLVELGAKYGVKAIAYEKPMALSMSEAIRICDVCERHNIKQTVCHQHKYGAHWRKVKQIIDSGDIGAVRTFHATSRGWYYEYITHLLDYTMFLNGAHHAEWVAAHIHGRRRLACAGHPSPDYMMAQIGFANGVRAIVETGPLAPSRGVAPQFRDSIASFWYDAGITAHGSGGFAEVMVGNGWRAATAGTGGQPVHDASVVFNEAGDTVPYIADMAHWLDNDRFVHPCDGRQALRGFEIAMAILQSGLDRRTVTLPASFDASPVERMLQELPEDPFGKEFEP